MRQTSTGLLCAVWSLSQFLAQVWRRGAQPLRQGAWRGHDIILTFFGNLKMVICMIFNFGSFPFHWEPPCSAEPAVNFGAGACVLCSFMPVFIFMQLSFLGSSLLVSLAQTAHSPWSCFSWAHQSSWWRGWKLRRQRVTNLLARNVRRRLALMNFELE